MWIIRKQIYIFNTRAIIRVGLFRLCPERVGTARVPRFPASIFGPLYKQTFIANLKQKIDITLRGHFGPTRVEENLTS